MKLNGNIPNINLGLSAGVIGLLIFTIIVGGYYITQVKDASEYNQKQIKSIRENQDEFTKHVIDQQDSTDKINNASRHLQIEQENQLLNLSRTNDKIIKQQLENEKIIINNTNNTMTSIRLQQEASEQRQSTQDNILDNLTALQNTTIQNQELIKLNQELTKNITKSNLNLTIHNREMLDDTNEDVNKLMELLNQSSGHISGLIE